MQLFIVNFEVTTREKFPLDMVTTADRYQLVAQNDLLTRILIKGVEAADSESAQAQAKDELGILLGLFLLNFGVIVKATGGAAMFRIEKNGRVLKGPVTSGKVSFRVLPQPKSTDLTIPGLRNPRIQKALIFYHLAETLYDTPAMSYLQLFFALDVLTQKSGLTPAQQDYERLRDAIVHVAPYHKGTAQFLLREFLTEDPNWNDTEVQRKILKRRYALLQEVKALLRKELP